SQKRPFDPDLNRIDYKVQRGDFLSPDEILKTTLGHTCRQSRFMLKQEEEKRKSAEMLYDKGRDQLRKKEDQCCKEMEEKQQLEMALRNMEREERHEAQRLLSQERNARALQEDFLNNLRRKNEEEEAARIIMTKTAEVTYPFSLLNMCTIRLTISRFDRSLPSPLLSITLERESMRHKQLESRNRELQDELYSMALSHKKQERHEKGRRHLEDEVTDLKRHLDSSKMDQSTMESFKREIEEKGRQEVRQKLEDVNLFLQTQAAAQDSLEQIRAATDASLRSQLESRIQDLETELHKIKSAQKESECQKESSQTELDRFKELYAEEMKMRKSLAGKLERCPLACICCHLRGYSESTGILVLSRLASLIRRPCGEFSIHRRVPRSALNGSTDQFAECSQRSSKRLKSADERR
uniref:Uncharacterized protein n=1 Tax=Leptobrachium leishanense TaxID=445787 RepID=A0A8C5MPL7_9ANUR